MARVWTRRQKGRSWCPSVRATLYSFSTQTLYILPLSSLPIPEGLPPLSAASLDVHLVDLIHRYTLQGLPILAHCRGGVGRAGLIACCWMIRLGLCGSIIPSHSEEGTGNSAQEVLSFVESIISLVRRRRSLKAIETYEQVKFVVEYVEYLWYGLRTPHDSYTPVWQPLLSTRKFIYLISYEYLSL